MATNLQTTWMQTMVAPAQLSMRQTGVPASVTLAQCVLESAWGTSQLARRCSNYFGIKALPGQQYGEFPTREVVTGRSVMELARFAKYPSAIESFTAHAQLLARHYHEAMASKRDAAAFAAGLQHGGYSTDPHYAASLLQLIHEFNLTQYDSIAPQPDQPATDKEAA